VGVNVAEGVAVTVAVGVKVAVGVGVKVAVAVGVNVAVAVGVGEGVTCGFSASKKPAHGLVGVSAAVPTPVVPAAACGDHAPATSPLPFGTFPYNWVREPFVAVEKLAIDSFLRDAANIRTAASLVCVVIAAAEIDVELPMRGVGIGVAASKGVEVLTPENATIAPAPPLSPFKVKL
jgi:hypothetical protein